MTLTLLDPPACATSAPAERLRITTAAVRVAFTWLGVRKALTPAQKTQAAEPFGAEGDFLSARKKLLDTKHAAYKAVTAVRGKVLSYWRSLTLPSPEPGVRRVKRDLIEPFHRQINDFRDQLADAVAA